MPPSLEDQEHEEDVYRDTIVVKGEYRAWPGSSSPNNNPHNHHHNQSLNPDLNVANLLAHTHPNLDFQQHHLDAADHETPNPPLGKTNRPQSRASRTPRSREKGILAPTMEDRLLAMPEKRPLPWREGVEAGAEIETGGDSRRKQIRFGCLLATRGEIQENPCISCANGRGKFSLCVALEGYFKGACASCQLSGRPNRCSIKKSDDDPDTSINETPSGGQESSMLGIQQQNQQTPIHTSSSTTSIPKPKRRKKDKPSPAHAQSTHTTIAPPLPVAENIPEWESARPQWEQELGDAHARQQLNEIVARPWSTVNDALGLNGINVNVIRPISHEHQNQRGTGTGTGMGWAAVNQSGGSNPNPNSNSNIHSQTPQNYTSGGVGDSDGGASYNRISKEQGRREDTSMLDDSGHGLGGGVHGGGPLIENLPREKQRVLYRVLSGLENGIQGLQRELVSLKRALGIEDD